MSERKTLEQFVLEVKKKYVMHYQGGASYLVEAMKLFHDQEMKAKDAEIERLSYRVIEAENCEELTAEIQSLKHQLSEREK